MNDIIRVFGDSRSVFAMLIGALIGQLIGCALYGFSGYDVFAFTLIWIGFVLNAIRYVDEMS